MAPDAAQAEAVALHKTTFEAQMHERCRELDAGNGGFLFRHGWLVRLLLESVLLEVVLLVLLVLLHGHPSRRRGGEEAHSAIFVCEGQA